jgi:hypothetical protein
MYKIINLCKNNHKMIERSFVLIGSTIGGIKGYNCSSNEFGNKYLYGNKLAGTIIGGCTGGCFGLITSAIIKYELGLICLGGTTFSYGALRYLDNAKPKESEDDK